MRSILGAIKQKIKLKVFEYYLGLGILKFYTIAILKIETAEP